MNYIQEALVDLGFDPNNESVLEQFVVMVEALTVYENRQPKYHDDWKRKGWRGNLFNLRSCVERAWGYLWNAPCAEYVDGDDLIDCINYAAMTKRLVMADNRDGDWTY